MSDAEPVAVSWRCRLREWLCGVFGTRQRAATVEETRLRAEVTRLQEQLAEREGDLRCSANALEAARAHARLLEMELADFALLRERLRSQWQADLSVEVRRAVGPDKGR